MTFTSFIFLLFFTVLFSLYYFLFKEKTKYQNWLLLLSSYFFYGYVNWKIIPILLIATVIVYTLGTAINSTKETKNISSWLTVLGVAMGVSLLVYFKYFNFFIESFSSVFNAIGFQTHFKTFDIIMPLGVSFFTFKLISYVVEVHRGKIEPTRDFVAFATYVAFFPTIMSGPIDRPNNFIPQLKSKRPFNYQLAVDGCRQILWGLFQKVVIADNLAKIINEVLDDNSRQSGSTLLIMAVFYTFQLYTDFSGYSHIAIGVSKVLGFRIAKNFNYPFFSRNIAEFWRNWHISLTSWLTDYVFTPLNIKFRDLGKLGVVLAIIINMAVVGLWHGANWTYIIFGLFHGLLFIPLVVTGAIFKKKKLKTNRIGLPPLNDFFRMIVTFSVVTLSLIIFRAENIGQTYHYFQAVFSGLVHKSDYIQTLNLFYWEIGFSMPILLIVFILAEWYGRESEYTIAHLGLKWKYPLRYSLYFIITVLIIVFGSEDQRFIYFQF